MANTLLKPRTVRFFELHEKKFVLLLCAFAAVHVFIFSAGFPFFNNVDEQMQFDVVLRYAHGEVPKKIDLISTNSAAYLGLMASPSEFWNKPPLGGYPAPLWALPAGEMRSVWAARSDSSQTRMNYELSQVPLYYMVGAVWWHIGGWVGLRGERLMYWLHFLNIVLVSSLVWLAYATARLLFPDHALPGTALSWWGFYSPDNVFLRLGVPVFLAFMPQNAFYSIENDVASPLFFGLTFYFLIRWLGAESPSAGLGAALGLAFAAAFLSKMTNIPLLAITAVVVFFKAWQHIRQGKGRETARALGGFLYCTGLPAIAWIAWCEVHFGDATGTAVRNQYLSWTVKPFSQWWHHPIFSPGGLWTYLSGEVGTFWQGEIMWHGYSLRLPGTDNLYTVLTLVLLAATLPALLWRSSNGPLAQTRVLQLALAYFVAELGFFGLMSIVYDYHNCFNPSPKHPYFMAGRMMLGALIPFLLVFVYGLDRLLSRFGRAIKFVTLIAMVAAMLSLEIVSDRILFTSPYNWYHLPQNDLVDLIQASRSPASVLYWDPQANDWIYPYPDDMSGTWENSLWSSSSSGQVAPVNWTDGDAVCFGVNTGSKTPPFAVLMNSNHTVAAVFDGSLNPNSCNVTVYGSGVMLLPAGLDAFAIHNASDGSLGIVTISNTIGGPGVLNPQQEGQLYLHGSNTWTGGTSLGYNNKAWEGTIYFDTANAFGRGTIYTSNGLNGSLVMEGSSSLVITNPVVFPAPVGTTLHLVGGPRGLTFAGPWTLDQIATLDIGDTNRMNRVSVAGVISGSEGLTITNASVNTGVFTLEANNSYRGDTTISSGTLAIGATGSISNTPTILVEGAGTFDVLAVAPFNLNAGQTLEGCGTVKGDVSIGSGATIAGGTATKIGTLSERGSLFLQGGGTNIEYVQNVLVAGAGNSTLNVGKNIGVLATRSSPFTIKLVSLTGTGEEGSVSNFDRTRSYSWTLATGRVTNFDSSDLVVDTSAFANRTGGTFSVSNTGSALVLDYKP